eukprot:3097416-Prymnesium_polylepis.1
MPHSVRSCPVRCDGAAPSMLYLSRNASTFFRVSSSISSSAAMSSSASGSSSSSAAPRPPMAPSGVPPCRCGADADTP